MSDPTRGSRLSYETTLFLHDPFFLREADRDVVAQLQEPERQDAMRRSESAQRYKASLSIAKQNLKKADAAGLLIVMGTDAGPFANRFQGFFEHLEMEMMAESGLTASRILRSATSDAARVIGVQTIGRIAKGAWLISRIGSRSDKGYSQHPRHRIVWIAGNEVRAGSSQVPPSGKLAEWHEAEIL